MLTLTSLVTTRPLPAAISRTKSSTPTPLTKFSHFSRSHANLTTIVSGAYEISLIGPSKRLGGHLIPRSLVRRRTDILRKQKLRFMHWAPSIGTTNEAKQKTVELKESGRLVTTRWKPAGLC